MAETLERSRGSQCRNKYLVAEAVEGPESLHMIRQILKRECRRRHIPDDVHDRVQGAVGEALANIVQARVVGAALISVVTPRRGAPRFITAEVIDFDGSTFEELQARIEHARNYEPTEKTGADIDTWREIDALDANSDGTPDVDAILAGWGDLEDTDKIAREDRGAGESGRGLLVACTHAEGNIEVFAPEPITPGSPPLYKGVRMVVPVHKATT